MKTVKNYMGSNTYYEEVLDREQIEKMIQEVKVNYEKVLDEAILEYGYTTYVAMKLDDGRLTYYCLQNNQYNHPADDFEVVLYKYKDDGDGFPLSYIEYIEREDCDDEEYRKGKDLLLSKKSFIDKYEDLELSTNEDVNTLIDELEYYSEVIGNLVEDIKGCKNLEDVEKLINDLVSDFNNSLDEDASELFDFIRYDLLLERIIEYTERVSGEDISEQLDYFYDDAEDVEQIY